MAIHELTEHEVLQHCPFCGSDNRVLLADLEAGMDGDGHLQPALVRLPACACGTQEFLIRSSETDPEHPVPGSFGHLHRLLVDHLHSELVRQGKVAPGLRDAQGQIPEGLRREVPADKLDKWFSKGLRIALPAPAPASVAAEPAAERTDPQ